jgi:probable phosphoglycerate mutase
MAEATGRAVAALAGIAAEHPDATVAAVSHCDIVRGAIAHHLGLPLDNMLRFDVAPASVSRLLIGDGFARVVSVNERLYQ